MTQILNPKPSRAHTKSVLKGADRTSRRRRTYWAKARQLRTQLRPVRLQKEVASILGLSRQAVEQIELTALAKVIGAFDVERADEFIA